MAKQKQKHLPSTETILEALEEGRGFSSWMNSSYTGGTVEIETKADGRPGYGWRTVLHWPNGSSLLSKAADVRVAAYAHRGACEILAAKDWPKSIYSAV